MTAIYKEYAEALFILARECGEEKKVLSELEGVCEVFLENSEYMDFISCPSIPYTERTDALAEAFVDLSEHALSFLCILCERGRIRELFDCVKEYKRLFDALSNTKTAQVYTSVAMTDEEKKRLTQKLEKKYNCTVSLECHIDESLLGGVVIELDGRVLDGSVKSQLHQLKDVISR